MSKINLKDQDAAVIFRASGMTEINLPTQGDEGVAYQTAVDVLRCVFLFEAENLDLLKKLDMRIDRHRQALKERAEKALP